MKRVAAVMMVLSLMGAALVGCKKENDNSAAKVEPGKLQEVYEAVKSAYGDAYIPSMPYDEMMLEDIFGIKRDMAKEVIAEGPMISAHVDTFVGLEAADGKAEEAKKALDAYRETLVNDTMQYPMNISKIQASQVYVVGDYVFFIMLGQIPDEMLEQGDESEMLKASQEQNQIAIDAINRVLGVEAK